MWTETYKKLSLTQNVFMMHHNEYSLAVAKNKYIGLKIINACINLDLFCILFRTSPSHPGILINFDGCMLPDFCMIVVLLFLPFCISP